MSNRVQGRRPGGKVGWLAGRLWVHRGAELGLLIVAAAALLVARVALGILPVRWLLRRAEGQAVGAPELKRRQVEAVRWAVLAVVRWSPVRFVCFPQCLAGGWMLRALGIGSTLHYGVTRTAGRLETHTWLMCDGRILLGGEERPRFEEIAVF